MKFAVASLALAASANAFSVAPLNRASTVLFNGPHLGSGGMADTRDPNAMNHEDARKSISAAPSFEEYLKMRDSGGAAPAAAPVAAPVAAPAAPPAWAPPAAAAPAPVAAAPAAGSSGAAGQYGAYDDQMWNMDAKQIIYGQWDPNSPRSPMNFNPFETWDGNSPDASGFFPGERRYKDPKRGDVSYAIMQAEQLILDEMKANPKPGNVPGAPGCRS